MSSLGNKTFDFIICGGGAAGLVLAARLSENPDFEVLVVEAGADKRDDPLVKTPGTFSQLYGNPEYDWDFKTVPQKEADGGVFAWPRGKGLGGSSMINYMMYSHCSKGDLNAWRALGNAGWGWDDVLPYFQKIEHMHLPNDIARSALSTEYIQPEMRGTTGPIQTSFQKDAFSWLQEAWPKLSKNMGYPTATDPRTGSSLGLFNQLTAVDPATSTRSYAASTYLAEAEKRPNLMVVTETLVRRILLDKSGAGGEARASGVELESAGTISTVQASKEVILCAGSVQSPQILELSGIGSRSILEKYGIEVVVENDNVGENLQDHIIVPISFEVNEGVPTAEAFRDNPELVPQLMEQYVKTGGGPFAAAPTATGFLSIDIVAPHVDFESLARSGPELPGKQFDLLTAQMKEPKESEYQIAAQAVGFDTTHRDNLAALAFHKIPGAYFTIAAGSTHGFSRGSVHIKSRDAKEYPEIDPRYFSNPADLEMLAHCALHLKKLASTPPLSQYIKSVPGGQEKVMMKGSLPLSTLEEAKAFSRANTVTMYHPVATASMLPRNEGGVVDANLKVYGAENLRVVDASIFPLHIQGNIMSMVYAIAEKGADLIKSSYSSRNAENGVNGVNGSH